MESIIKLMALVSSLMLGGAIYETARAVLHVKGAADPLSIMVFYIMGIFWGGAAIYLYRQENNKLDNER